MLTLARADGQLQGVKKGVLELAVVVAVNKADGPYQRDRPTARELVGALRPMHGADAFWHRPSVLSCSARAWSGLDAVRERLSVTGPCWTPPDG